MTKEVDKNVVPRGEPLYFVRTVGFWGDLGVCAVVVPSGDTVSLSIYPKSVTTGM